MQEDFHYYATYCASFLAGYSHEDSLTIAYSAQFVDCCSRTFLRRIRGPLSAATTQLQGELINQATDIAGLQDVTRIWASFHFLPADLYAKKKGCGRRYLKKYRLICGPNSDLLRETVELASGHGLQAAGIAMHVLADTWAHRYFAGTPSLVINNTDFHFEELLEKDGQEIRRPVRFRHSASLPDDLERGLYTNSVQQNTEDSVMLLGHGRAGHLPDYSFARYAYLPAWGDYEEVLKDNPKEYYQAFTQMIYALRFLRGELPAFETDHYDTEKSAPYEERIRAFLKIRQLSADRDWKALGEELSGKEIPAFDLDAYTAEYTGAVQQERTKTFLGRFLTAAMAQKSLVTGRIFQSGSLLAGFSVEIKNKGFRGIRDYMLLLEEYYQKELTETLETTLHKKT